MAVTRRRDCHGFTLLIDQLNATGRCDLTNFSDTDLIIQCLDAGG